MQAKNKVGKGVKNPKGVLMVKMPGDSCRI